MFVTRCLRMSNELTLRRLEKIEKDRYLSAMHSVPCVSEYILCRYSKRIMHQTKEPAKPFSLLIHACRKFMTKI